MISKLGAILLLVAAVLSGCTMPDDEGNAAVLDADSYTLAVTHVPTSVAVGYPFTIDVGAAGPPGHSTDHFGAHMGTMSTTAPSTDIYTLACSHDVGDLPGTVQATCAASSEGLWYLRGHLRVIDGATWNYWSTEEFPINAVALDEDAYMVTTTGVPSTAMTGQPFTFTVQAAGPSGPTTDHIGAHYGATSTDQPSTTVYDQVCAHGVGDLPMTFEVTCTMQEAGTHYLRGHLRITDGTETYNYWGPEVAITVS